MLQHACFASWHNDTLSIEGTGGALQNWLALAVLGVLILALKARLPALCMQSIQGYSREYLSPSAALPASVCWSPSASTLVGNFYPPAADQPQPKVTQPTCLLLCWMAPTSFLLKHFRGQPLLCKLSFIWLLLPLLLPLKLSFVIY